MNRIHTLSGVSIDFEQVKTGWIITFYTVTLIGHVQNLEETQVRLLRTDINIKNLQGNLTNVYRSALRGKTGAIDI